MINGVCNDLERLLLERGYSLKLGQKEILQARIIPRDELLNKEKSQGKDSKLTFNFTYYPMFRHLKSPLKELHVVLACDENIEQVFPDVPIIGFKKNKNLKSIIGFKKNENLKVLLVGTFFPDINEEGRYEPWDGMRPPFQLCNDVKNTNTFKCKHSNKIYQITKCFNCNSKMVVYLIECRVCCN